MIKPQLIRYRQRLCRPHTESKMINMIIFGLWTTVLCTGEQKKEKKPVEMPSVEELKEFEALNNEEKD